MKKTASKIGLQSTINIGVMIMFILFSVGFTSAFEFDNVKDYDTQTKTATITNALGLGDKIADVKLKSDTAVQVGLGYQKVFEYEINSLTDYKEFIQELEIYNLKSKGIKENKQIDLKYLVIEDRTYDLCVDEDCTKKIKESSKVGIWKDLNSVDMKVEKLIISGWTDVKQGDYYEWIPNFAGVKVEEWATWSGNLSVGIISYWSLNQTSTLTDSLGVQDGVLMGSSVSADGKFNNSIDNPSSTSGIRVNDKSNYEVANGSISMWVYADTHSSSYTSRIVNKGLSNNDTSAFNFQANDGTPKRLDFTLRNAGDTANYLWTSANASTVIPIGKWTHIVLTWGGSGMKVYFNGTLNGTEGTYSGGGFFNTVYDWQFSGWGGTNRFFDGKIDEVLFFGREITQTEVTLLYNNYSGCVYENESCYTPPIVDNPPTIALNSPDNASTSNSYSNTFTCTGTDDYKVQNISFYINGTYNQTNTSVFNNTATSFSTNLAEGYYNWSCQAWDNATIPQSAISTRNLLVDLGSPSVTLNSPVEMYNSTDKDIVFNCSVTDNNGVQNVSLLINGTYNQTNTSGLNNTAYLFSVALADGNYNWTCNSKNINSKSTDGTPRNIVINTKPTISITPPPTNTSNYTTSSIDIEATSSLSVDYWIVNYNGTNVTIVGQSGTSLLEPFVVSDGSYRLLLYANNSDSGRWGLNDTIYFNVDTIHPQINITSPLVPSNYQTLNTNIMINWTVTDAHIDKCWYNYKGTNTTVTCSANTTNINITDWFNKNFTFWANDTFGNYNSTFFSWDYRLFFISESYNSSVLEGSIQQFSTLLITNGTDITIGNLSYNGTGYLGSVSKTGNNFTITRSLITPTITSNTNMSFFWKITQSDGFVYNYTAKNQTLLNLGIDNCSVNGNVLYNFTMLDEKLQTEINETGGNSLAEINLQVYSYGTTTQISSFNSKYNQTNPFAICFNNTFVDEKYSVDAQVRYIADTYESEYYHIQNATINNASFPTAINLYDLNISNSQAFKLIYKDSSYLPVKDALIVIGRKYVDEGTFKNVEIPKTDSYGETVAHLELNNIIYNFTIIKNNVILGTFDNMFAICQTPLVTECVIEFNSFAGSVGVPNFDSEGDFEYDLGYLSASRTVQANFTLPSGNPSTILLRVEKSDALGTDICTDTLTSASGTLSCVLPASIGNQTIIATLYKDGYYKSWGNLKVNQTPTDIYGTTIMVFLSIVILLTLGGIALSGNPIITVVLLMVGVILMFALNLVASNGFIGGTATILFFVIACILLLIKGVKR